MFNSTSPQALKARPSLPDFWQWVLDNRAHLDYRVATLEARTAELCPLLCAGVLSEDEAQKCIEMCALCRLAQIDFALFNACFLLAKGGECPDFLPLENLSALRLWDRYLAFKASSNST